MLFTIYVVDNFQIIEKHLPKAQGYADDHQVYLSFRPIHSTTQTASVAAIENRVAELRSWMIFNMLMVNDNKTGFLIVRSKQQPKRVNIPLIHVGEDSNHTCDVSANLGVILTPTWKWICKSQKPAKTPTIISTTSGESENSWARKPRARWYMHLLKARLTTATVWWMDYQRISSRNSSLCKTQLPNQFSIWGNMIAWLLHLLRSTGFQLNTGLNSKQCWSSSKDFMARHLPTSKKWSSHQKKKRYSTRSNEERIMEVPKFKHGTFGKRAFAVYGPLEWDCLPKEIKLCDKTEAFKRNLKTHFLLLFFC